MEIRFTHHAEDKLRDESYIEPLAITKQTIATAILHPDFEEVLEDGKLRLSELLASGLTCCNL